jgi:hypothetical protein
LNDVETQIAGAGVVLALLLNVRHSEAVVVVALNEEDRMFNRSEEGGCKSGIL